MRLLSLSLFLNRYPAIRFNSLLSDLAWFLLPVGLIVLVVAKSDVEYQTDGSEEEIKYALLVNLPFLVALIWNFIKFRSQVNAEKKHS